MQGIPSCYRERRQKLEAPRNAENFIYFSLNKCVFKLLVNGTQFSRDLSELAEAASGARTLALPNTVKNTHVHAFVGKKKLLGLRFGTGARVLETAGMFSGTSLVYAYFSSSVTRLSPEIFRGADSLRVVEFGRGLKVLGEAWLRGSAVECVLIPKSVRVIESRAFQGCTHLNKVVFAAKSKLTFIGDAAFSGCVSLAEISLPKSLQKVGFRLFEGCKALREVRLEAGCSADLSRHVSSKVRLITFPDTTFKIGNTALCDLRALKSVTLPVGLTEIGEFWFANCAIEAVHVPASVETIRVEAFQFCTSLREVEFEPDSVLKEIETRAFAHCTLTNFTTPHTLARLGEAAFDGCHVLRNVQLHEGLLALGDCCFRKCALSNLLFPISVESVGESTLEGVRLRLSSGRSKISTNLLRSSGIRALEIPASVVEIKESALDGCATFSEVTFAPDSKLICIGSRAFANTAVESVALPSSLRELEHSAFRCCSKLRHVELPVGLVTL